MASGFRSSIFDPLQTAAQIVALQACFYTSLSLWIVLADLLTDTHRSIGQIFDYKEFQRNYYGRLVIVATILNSLTSALALWWIVRRAKKCLDFSATVYIIHFALCIGYGGFPLSVSWWVSNLIGFGIMTIVSEWLSWRTELAPIPITGGSSNNTVTNNTTNSSTA